MIWPVLTAAKESARMRTCGENLRQLGFALLQYMDAHNGFGLPLSPPEYENPWVLYVPPLFPYISGKRIATQPRTGSPTREPKSLWMCPGDINRGDDRPCWWHWGASYMYPGPTAYITGNDPWRKSPDSVPRKPMLWKNHRRDILLADFWPDYHGGQRVERQLDEKSLTPPPLVQGRSTNVLFLDVHLEAVTLERREQCRAFTTGVDNPYYKPPAPPPGP